MGITGNNYSDEEKARNARVFLLPPIFIAFFSLLNPLSAVVAILAWQTLVPAISWLLTKLFVVGSCFFYPRYVLIFGHLYPVTFLGLWDDFFRGCAFGPQITPFNSYSTAGAILGSLASIGLLYGMVTRIEPALAEYKIYWLARHVWRVALIPAAVYLWSDYWHITPTGIWILGLVGAVVMHFGLLRARGHEPDERGIATGTAWMSMTGG